MADIRVNGRDYPLAVLDDVTLGEARTIQKYTGESLDKVDGINAGVLSALVHITIARVEPTESFESIQRVVDAMSFTDLLEQLNKEGDEQSVPPSEPTRNDGSDGERGGSSSPTGESPQDSKTQNGTGSPGLATGATSDPLTWAG